MQVKKDEYATDRAHIFRMATIKYLIGGKEHGPWSPGKIDLIAEMKAECLDLINYASMMYIELNRLDFKMKVITGTVALRRKIRKGVARCKK